MNNEGFTGFLIKKTLQPFPLRGGEDGEMNFNEYRDRNIILFLQKKFGNLRKRKGDNYIPQNVINQTVLQNKNRLKEQPHEINTPFKLENEVRLILKQYNEAHPKFEEAPSAPRQPVKAVRKHPKLDTKQQLQVIMNDNISETNLKVYFKQYQRQNLRATLNEFKTSLQNQKQLSSKFTQQGFQNLEFEDQEQVNFFMKQTCEKLEVDACKLLEVEYDNITFKEEIMDELEVMKSIVQKRITKEQMKEILEDEERRQNNQLVQIFKETRIDQFDPDFLKNKGKMTTMKRVTEAQDEKFHNFFSASDDKQNTLRAENFYRSRKDYSKSRLITSPTSRKSMAISTTTRPTTSFTTRGTASEHNMMRLIQQCDQVTKNDKLQHKSINQKFSQLDMLVGKAAQYLEVEKPPAVTVPNQDFEYFKKERLFKKKFVNFVIEKVEKQSDLLSLKVKTDHSKKLIEEVLAKSQ